MAYLNCTAFCHAYILAIFVNPALIFLVWGTEHSRTNIRSVFWVYKIIFVNGQNYIHVLQLPLFHWFFIFFLNKNSIILKLDQNEPLNVFKLVKPFKKFKNMSDSFKLGYFRCTFKSFIWLIKILLQVYFELIWLGLNGVVHISVIYYAYGKLSVNALLLVKKNPIVLIFPISSKKMI
jgi:hypothetical protein